jgi:hypothetical protein
MLVIVLPGYTLSHSGWESLRLELKAFNSYRLPFAIIYRIIPYAPCAFSCMLARKCLTLCSRRVPGKALSHPEETAIHSSIAKCPSLLLLHNKRMSVSYPIVIPSYGVAMPVKCPMMIAFGSSILPKAWFQVFITLAQSPQFAKSKNQFHGKAKGQRSWTNDHKQARNSSAEFKDTFEKVVPWSPDAYKRRGFMRACLRIREIMVVAYCHFLSTT